MKDIEKASKLKTVIGSILNKSPKKITPRRKIPSPGLALYSLKVFTISMFSKKFTYARISPLPFRASV